MLLSSPRKERDVGMRAIPEGAREGKKAITIDKVLALHTDYEFLCSRSQKLLSFLTEEGKTHTKREGIFENAEEGILVILENWWWWHW